MDDLIRTQIMLLPIQKQAVDQMGVLWNVSMSEVVRRAVDNYIKIQLQKRAQRMELAERLAGSWKNSKNWKNIDASAWQRKLRREKGI